MIDNIAPFGYLATFKRIVSVSAALLFLLCAGCANMFSSPYPPVPESQVNVDVDYEYILGPGDSVDIFVWGNEELSNSGSIRPDGKLTTYLVEDLPASGRTTTQLARDIEEAYSEYVRQPVISVTVSGYRGIPEQQIRIMGEAVNPKVVQFTKHMTLLDLMIKSGGLTNFAAGNRSVLVRKVDGKEVTYSLRLDDLVKDGDITANLNVMPGDILIIAEAWF